MRRAEDRFGARSCGQAPAGPGHFGSGVGRSGPAGWNRRDLNLSPAPQPRPSRGQPEPNLSWPLRPNRRARPIPIPNRRARRSLNPSNRRGYIADSLRAVACLRVHRAVESFSASRARRAASIVSTRPKAPPRPWPRPCTARRPQLLATARGAATSRSAFTRPPVPSRVLLSVSLASIPGASVQ